MNDQAQTRQHISPARLWFGFAGSALSWIALGVIDLLITWQACLGAGAVRRSPSRTRSEGTLSRSHASALGNGDFGWRDVVPQLARTFPRRKSYKRRGTRARRVHGLDRSFCQFHAGHRNRPVRHAPRHYRSLCEGQMKAHVLLAAALPMLLMIGCTGGRALSAVPRRYRRGRPVRQECNSIFRLRRMPHDSGNPCRLRRTRAAAEFFQPPHHDRGRAAEYA